MTEEGIARDLHSSHEVAILSISLFVEGLGELTHPRFVSVF